MNKRNMKQKILVIVFVLIGMSMPQLILSTLVGESSIGTTRKDVSLRIYPNKAEEGVDVLDATKKNGRLSVRLNHDDRKLLFIEGEESLLEMFINEDLREYRIKIYNSQTVVCSFKITENGKFEDFVFPQDNLIVNR